MRKYQTRGSNNYRKENLEMINIHLYQFILGTLITVVFIYVHDSKYIILTMNSLNIKTGFHRYVVIYFVRSYYCFWFFLLSYDFMSINYLCIHQSGDRTRDIWLTILYSVTLEVTPIYISMRIPSNR